MAKSVTARLLRAWLGVWGTKGKRGLVSKEKEGSVWELGEQKKERIGEQRKKRKGMKGSLPLPH